MTFGISKSKLWENVLFSMNCMSKTFLENLSNLALISLWLVLCFNCQCLLHPLALNWTRSSFLGIIALFDLPPLLTLSNSFSATKSLQIQRPKSSHYLIKLMFVYFWIEMEWGTCAFSKHSFLLELPIPGQVWTLYSWGHLHIQIKVLNQRTK